MKDFYLVIKAKVEAGQYKLEDMLSDLQLAYEKDRITLEQHEELAELAKVRVDMEYEGNKHATSYDLDQDVTISDHDLSIVDLYEMVLMSSTSTQQAKFSSRNIEMGRSISNSYVRLIIKGARTFESVPEPMKQEVAEKLIEEGRQDLITDPEYLPQEEIDPDFSINPEEVPVE